MNSLPSRRDALKTGAALVGSALVSPFRGKRIASINTAYYLRSHAYHIAGRFLHGYPVNGVHHQPEWKLARMFNDQFPLNDLSRGLATKFGFEISKTVAEALGESGGLDVDAILLVGEHGQYPNNETGQKLYPRHRLFMEIVDTFRKCGKSVPVFSDKHLSYDTKQAVEMVAASRELKFGLMAGSSLPVTWRRPELEPAIGTPIAEALVCGYSGGEAYMFHCLEALQVLMERRSPRETGVKAVTGLRGDAVWKAGDQGLWSRELLEAALARSPSRNYGHPENNCPDPWAFLIEYKDGSRGTCLQLTEHVADFTFAGRVKGQKEPISTLFELPAPPGARYFSALTYHIEKLFGTGTPPYPVERTLLTGAILDYGMRSLAAGGKRMEDVAMEVSYPPPSESGFFKGPSSDR
ncbi:MAG TPA: hypothetical protein VKU80_19050 [Planctomycetota bacterium]|nr:hypothetical protein [Planctomycetota bacterium]